MARAPGWGFGAHTSALLLSSVVALPVVRSGRTSWRNSVEQKFSKPRERLKRVKRVVRVETGGGGWLLLGMLGDEPEFGALQKISLSWIDVVVWNQLILQRSCLVNYLDFTKEAHVSHYLDYLGFGSYLPYMTTSLASFKASNSDLDVGWQSSLQHFPCSSSTSEFCVVFRQANGAFATTRSLCLCVIYDGWHMGCLAQVDKDEVVSRSSLCWCNINM